MITCHDVANYILWKVGPLTSINLQKLVYLCHCWWLADHGLPLFQERIIADDEGPIIPEIMIRFADYHQSQVDARVPKPNLSVDESHHVNWILTIYLFTDPRYLNDHGCYDPAWHRAMYWVPDKEIQREDIIDFYGQ
jgi:uncharacterized phage-associated protein